MSGLANVVDMRAINQVARVRPWSVDDPTFCGVFKSRLEKGQPVYANVAYHGEGGDTTDFLLLNSEDWQILRSNPDWARPQARLQFSIDVTWLNGVASPELLEPFWDEQLNLFCGVIGSPTRLCLPRGGAYKWLNDNLGHLVALVQDPVCWGTVTAYIPADGGEVIVGTY